MRKAIELLWPYLRPQRAALTLAVMAMVGEVATALLAPVPLQLIFNRIIRPLRGKVRLDTHLHLSDIEQLLGFALLVVAIAMADALFSYIDLRETAHVAQRATTELRRALYSHLQRLSLAFHQERDTRLGDLQMRLSGDVQTMQDLVSGSLANVVTNGATTLLMLALLLIVDLRIGVVAVAAAIVVYLLTRHYRVRLREIAKQARGQEGRVNAMVAETLNASKLVQAYGQEDREARRLRRETDVGLDFSLRAAEYQARVQPLVTLTTAIGTAAVLLLGAMLTMKQVITVGSLVLVLAYTRGVFSSLRQLAKLTTQTQKSSAAAERVAELLSRAPSVASPSRPKALPPPPLGVRFSHVTFGYVPDKPVIRDLSLEIPPGATLALVGPTGVGKTSLVSLVPRFYDAWEGSVSIGGVDVREISLTSLRANVTMVLQEALLFRDTVHNNIAYGREDASPTEVYAAAEAAGVLTFIDELEDGFETVVSERGATLSGGQKQCVAIARALLRNAQIVIMDEPTSSLDSITERTVISGLEALLKGRTAIVIAHRFTTIQNADLVAVLDEGRLVEFGEPHRLLLDEGLYAALSTTQGIPS